jgi:hypothetical protein
VARTARRAALSGTHWGFSGARCGSGRDRLSRMILGADDEARTPPFPARYERWFLDGIRIRA